MQYTLEALGLRPSTAAAAEQTAAQKVAALLESVMNETWPSGKPENNSAVRELLAQGTS